MFPVDAMTPRSDARHDARGPSRPNGVTATQTAPGASDRRAQLGQYPTGDLDRLAAELDDPDPVEQRLGGLPDAHVRKLLGKPVRKNST